MKKNTTSNLRYLDLMQSAINSLDELSEKAGNFEDSTFDCDYSYAGSFQMDPLVLFDKKLKDLNKHLRNYADSSTELYLELIKLDMQMTTKETTLAEKAEIFAALNRNTAKILRDIKLKQTFLKNFIDPTQTYNLAHTLECPETLQGIQDICSEANQTLDEITKLINDFSKYSSRYRVLPKADIEINKKDRLLRRVSININGQNKNLPSALHSTA